MKGKAAGAKKAAPPVPAAKKAGNAMKKAGGMLQPGNLVPRDFVIAQRDMMSLISDYGGIQPLIPAPRQLSLRELIIAAVKAHDFNDFQQLEKKHKDKFMNEVHLTSCENPILIVCAENSNAEALQKLLMLKVSPNQVSLAGETAMHAAARADFEVGVIMLHSFGATFWLSDGSGNTPFLLAAVRGSERVMQRLVEFGANPWKKDGAGKYEIEYIEDAEIRKRIATKAYWLRKRGFAWISTHSRFTRLGFNLTALVSTYL